MKKKTNKLPFKPLKDSKAVKDFIIEMLYGDLYWHEAIRDILATAGFVTRRIERMETHPIWRLWLTRTSFDLASDQRTAAKQIRRILVKGGIKVVGDQFDIIDRRGDKLRCYLVLDLGAPGVA
ncbi:MAG TPA: hypothetical protein VGO67_14875 [Verrucomicrobiae bacterium]